MAAATEIHTLSKAKLRDMLRQMMLIREFEDKTAEWYARGRIAGFVHLYNGQEANAVGIAALFDINRMSAAGFEKKSVVGIEFRIKDFHGWKNISSTVGFSLAGRQGKL